MIDTLISKTLVPMVWLIAALRAVIQLSFGMIVIALVFGSSPITGVLAWLWLAVIAIANVRLAIHARRDSRSRTH